MNFIIHLVYIEKYINNYKGKIGGNPTLVEFEEVPYI